MKGLSSSFNPAKFAEVPHEAQEGPGTNPGTGNAYHPTALPTVGPYALPVPSFVPGRATLASQGTAQALTLAEDNPV